jgi:hypothetical protein
MQGQQNVKVKFTIRLPGKRMAGNGLVVYLTTLAVAETA